MKLEPNQIRPFGSISLKIKKIINLFGYIIKKTNGSWFDLIQLPWNQTIIKDTILDSTGLQLTAASQGTRGILSYQAIS